MFGNRLELDSHLVTTTFSHTLNIESAVRLAGAEIRSFVVTSVASSEAALHPDELKLGVMLVDIGDGVSDIAIYMDSSIVYTAAIPCGSGAITSDLSAAFRISLGDARRLKHKYGSFSIDSVSASESPSFVAAEIGSSIQKLVSNPEMAEIIQPRMDELFYLIRGELIKSGCFNLLPAGVVLTGGGALLCGVAEHGARVLRMPVRVGSPLSEQLPAIYRIPENSTCIGLSLFAASNAYNMRPKKRLDLAEAVCKTMSFLHRVNVIGD
jgi:cell division protein FtsA